VEDWAEIRRLHRSEQVPIKEISRRLRIARNTVREALRSDAPPQYSRAPRGSAVDDFEPQIRLLLKEFPRMPATVIAERIGWRRSMTVLKDRVRLIRPEYVGIDPADRTVYVPGGISQWDLWFPPYRIPLGNSLFLLMPVLVATMPFSRMAGALMLPSRQGGDLTAGMWSIMSELGAVTHKMVWDRESAIGGKGKPTALATAFAGTLGTRLVLAPARDPEFKGMVERNNRYYETSFMPGREFGSPADFNAQFGLWLTDTANQRLMRSLGGRSPVDLWDEDRAAMMALPPTTPVVGLRLRTRLARDYYIRVASNDYSVDPAAVGRFVDIIASPDRVVAHCNGSEVANHDRHWGTHATIADPAHVAAAKGLRAQYRQEQATQARRRIDRTHNDGHRVTLRALPDYDDLYGVNFQNPSASELG